MCALLGTSFPISGDKSCGSQRQWLLGKPPDAQPLLDMLGRSSCIAPRHSFPGETLKRFLTGDGSHKPS